MNKLTLFATVAISCSGLHTCVAQIQILGGGPATAPPRLVADQHPLVEVEPIPLTFTAQAGETIPNPFDYFSPEPLAEPTVPAETTDSPAESAETSETDPASLPVGRGHRRSVVDTLVDHATMASVEDAALTPVFWGVAPKTPNAVAQWLLREQCVEGLWAHYPAQRAAECTTMRRHLSGHCQHCPPSHCAAPGAACGGAPRNRYLEQPCGAASSDCGCQGEGQAAAANYSPLPVVGELPCAQATPSLPSGDADLPAELPHDSTERSNVAQRLPSLLR